MSAWAVFPFLLVLLLLSAFFSAAETAFFSLQRETVLSFKNGNRRRGHLVAQLLETPRELLATILFGNLVVNVLFYSMTALAAYNSAKEGHGAVAVATGAGGLVAVIIFGEVLPKAVALSFGEGLSQLVAGPLYVVYQLLRPVRYGVGALVRALTVVAMRVVNPPRRITREELSMLVEVTREQGHIPPHEGEMIEEVMGLSETRVREVMAPRVDIVAVEEGATLEELVEVFRKTRRTKVPVYRETIDHIRGIAYVKKALLGPAESLKEVTGPVTFVPEAKTAESLLYEFQKTRLKMAVVVDEYGGTAGVVTLADLVEEIVGPIGDEYEAPERLVEEMGPGRYRLAGDLSIREWNELFNTDLESERLSTLGGFVVYLLGHMPRRGDTADYQNVRFTVEEVRKHRIVSLRTELLDENGAGRGAR